MRILLSLSILLCLSGCKHLEKKKDPYVVVYQTELPKKAEQVKETKAEDKDKRNITINILPIQNLSFSAL